MTVTLLRNLSRLAALGAVAVLVGCSGAPDRPPVTDVGEGGAAAGGAGGASATGTGGSTTQPLSNTGCTDGVARECKVRLPSHNGVTNCFVGVQLCDNGAWGKCMDPADVPGNG